MSMPGMRTSRTNMRLVGCKEDNTVYVVKTPPFARMEILGKLVGIGAYRDISVLQDRLEQKTGERLWQTHPGGSTSTNYLYSEDINSFRVLRALEAQGDYGEQIVERVRSNLGKNGLVKRASAKKSIDRSIGMHKDFVEKHL